MDELRRIPQVTLVLLALAIAHQALIALGVVRMGDVSGSKEAFWWVPTLALVALLVAGVALVVAAARGAVLARATAVVLLIPAAGLLAIVHLYAYDPYYLPTLRRFGDYRENAEWIAIIVAVSLLFAVAGRFGRRVGVAAVGAGAWIAAVAIVLEGGLH